MSTASSPAKPPAPPSAATMAAPAETKAEEKSMAMEGISLTQFIMESQRKHAPEAAGDLSMLLASIEVACKVIASAVRKAGISGLYGMQGSVNVQGEEVKKLDVLSNDNFIHTLKYCKKVATMVSEENPKEILVEGTDGKYAVAFDPLDGSSNIDCNVSVGSIFGIYRREDPKAPPSAADILQPGNKLCAAGYTMYGSSTQLVLTFGAGVHIFTLDPAVGVFLMSSENVRIPEKPKTIYSINEGNWTSFDEPTKKFIVMCKEHKPKPYSHRYVGSMVADVHRTLLYGGVFMYPATASAPKGKLRLLYECNPMSFIIEQAGGKATTGSERVLDVIPTDIHERRPIILGCTRDVETIEKLYAEEAAAAGGGGGATGDAKRARIE